MLEIIYQDEWLVAVNKPSGWLVHRSWLDRDEKVVVMQTVRDQIGQHVFTAHRLDRPTSGVLLMGLSSVSGMVRAARVAEAWKGGMNACESRLAATTALSR